jgi:hypothetical protein
MSGKDADRSRATLDYLSSMLRELREIAEAERYDMLAYFINMAEVEAGDITKGSRPARVLPEKPAGKSRSRKG